MHRMPEEQLARGRRSCGARLRVCEIRIEKSAAMPATELFYSPIAEAVSIAGQDCEVSAISRPPSQHDPQHFPPHTALARWHPCQCPRHRIRFKNLLLAKRRPDDLLLRLRGLCALFCRRHEPLLLRGRDVPFEWTMLRGSYWLREFLKKQNVCES